ncbi:MULTISPECIES: YcjX family protein [unclassified Colwellia]|jgi:predicted YcjX-like family ATPase|uniref:YcjX family protein n=1 Tax=unclassified Colwellia TaxID=196834 RepID=UPI001C70BF5A|nr:MULTISPECIES: YcjX family protein [unclassified Colwellia]
MAFINKIKLNKLKQKASDLLNRTLDQHVTLAVTGLSRSGKTAFITSLVNQLVNEGNNSQLGFFNVVHQGRFIAAKRVPQKHLHIGRFEYDQAMSAFSQNEPTWPEPTHGISEMRLAIRYKPKESLLKYASDTATLYLDITDYPGEWLLDLPMLNQTFEQWSQQTTALLLTEPRFKSAETFIEKVNQIDPFAKVDEQRLADLSKEYTELLLHFRHELGLSVIQPGRFILPGELADAPILQFFPFTAFEKMDKNAYQNASDDCLIGMLRARFIEYKERVVKAFYKEHFVNFDRQIVLADCLTPLNNGPESFADLKTAMTMIMESFSYGQSSLFSRLFAPKIDKLLFAATKADHVTPEQHHNLVRLLDQLVYQTKHQLNYDVIEMKTLALASVKTTQAGTSRYQGQDIPVLRGKRSENGELITVFPGAVPNKLPEQDYWQQETFNFISFAPMDPIGQHECLPHLRMDQVMQFLLGDKMK